MQNAPYLPYRWCNEQGSLTSYQSDLVRSGRRHSEDWEQIEFESFLAEKFPDSLSSYRWNQKKRLFRQRLVGIFSSLKSFLRE